MINKKSFKKLIILTMLLFALAFSFYLYGTKSSIYIVYTADIQGFIRPHEDFDWSRSNKQIAGGSANLGAVVNKIRASAKRKGGFILLDTGDFFQGAPEGNFFKGHSLIEIMNALGYDAITLGDRDFAFGEQNLRNLAREAQFPFLGANIIEERTGNPPDYIKPYIIKNIKGIKVGIIGLTTPLLKYHTLPENIKGLKFLPPLETAKKYVSQLKKEDVNFIILLSHIGLEQDLEIVEKVHGINVIIGSNDKEGWRLEELNIVKNDTIIVTSWEKGAEIYPLQFIFDRKSNEIIKYKQKKIYLDVAKFKPDQKIQKIVEKYIKLTNLKKEEVIGYSKETLTRAIDKESTLGNWIADVLRTTFQADIALVGGLKSDLEKGDITMGDIYNISPIIDKLEIRGFNVAVLELTGESIKYLLERSLGWAQEFSKYGILQVSGLKVTYDPQKEAGKRILEITINGKELDPGKTYKVVINDYLASGGDSYYDIIKAKNRRETGLMTFDVLVEYVKTHSPIEVPSAEGRIVRLE